MATVYDKLKIEVTKTHCENLLNVFHNSYSWDDRNDYEAGHIPPLEVPYFQRLYEWPTHMVENFTSKLFETYVEQWKDSKDSNIFFASTVFLHLEENPSKHCPKHNKCRALIMDGQQRLITLSLIILVLKDRLSKRPSSGIISTSSSPTSSSSPHDMDDSGSPKAEDLVEKLNIRLFCKVFPRISVPRLTAHPDQHEVSLTPLSSLPETTSVTLTLYPFHSQTK